MATTYNVANVSALDQKRTDQRLLRLHIHVERRVISTHVLLSFASLADPVQNTPQLHHIVVMHTHIGGQDGVDHKLLHGGAFVEFGPVLAEDIREGGTMIGFQNGPITVQSGERVVGLHQEAVVDSWMPNIMTNGGDEECERYVRLDALRELRV